MSIYNRITVRDAPSAPGGGGHPRRLARIVVDCHPDQFTRDTVSLDLADYQEIKAAALRLGWEQDRDPQVQRMKLLAADLLAALDTL